MDKPKREFTGIQMDIIKRKYIQKAIENNVEKKQKEIIKNNYIEKYVKEKTHDQKVESAIKHAIDVRNSGDKSRTAYQNCYYRCPNFIGTHEEFKEQIERKFSDGMEWDNYPEWEVDHIFPLAKGGAHHFRNLQPLWKTENQSKWDKIIMDDR